MDVDGQEQLNGLSDSDVELRDQLYELADATLQAHSEHLLFLERYDPQYPAYVWGSENARPVLKLRGYPFNLIL